MQVRAFAMFSREDREDRGYNNRRYDRNSDYGDKPSYNNRDRGNGKFERRDRSSSGSYAERSSYSDRSSRFSNDRSGSRQVNNTTGKKPLIETVTIEEVESKITLGDLRPNIREGLV